MRVVGALLLLGACWAGESPPRSTPPARAAPRPLPVAAATVAQPAAKQRERAYRDDPALAAQVRVSGAHDLTTWVADPLVVLDLDTGAFATLCGSAAQAAARSFGARLADPARDTPHCGVHITTGGRRCIQLDGTNRHGEILVVELATAARPRLVTAITGHLGLNVGLEDQLELYAATATCP